MGARPLNQGVKWKSRYVAREGADYQSSGGWGPGVIPAISGSSPGAKGSRFAFSSLRSSRMASLSFFFLCRSCSFLRFRNVSAIAQFTIRGTIIQTELGSYLWPGLPALPFPVGTQGPPFPLDSYSSSLHPNSFNRVFRAKTLSSQRNIYSPQRRRGRREFHFFLSVDDDKQIIPLLKTGYFAQSSSPDWANILASAYFASLR